MRTRAGRGAARADASTSAGRAGEPFRPVGEHGVRLFMGKDDRLTAFARAEGGLVRWTQRRAGAADWGEPELLPAPRLTHLSITQGADGFVHFVGRRVSADGDSVAVVQAVQYQTGRPLTQWHTIGNPHKDPERARAVTGPGGAVSATGRLHVFLARADGGVMMRQEAANGRWPAWKGLKGQLAQEGAVAVASASGRIELLVPDTVGRTMRWRQSEPDGEPERCPNIHIAPAPGTLTGIETAAERFTYYWADAATGGVFAHRPGSWVIPLGGGPVSGRIQALRMALDGYDCTVLAHRSTDGDVMLAACATENESAGLWWAPTGERCVGPPALIRDVYGRLLIAVLGEEGELRVAEQTPASGLVMGPAVRV
ncbi:hypothetical protein [Streptomyces griseus]|uniref:hypothetical protein n=1 Tax=Streptomyces griseus TaxID=1911 RepID=UPI0008403C7C|nr:hypothetical protein [Streptomyces griseus]